MSAGALMSLTSQSDASVRAHKFSGADGCVAFAELRPDATYYLSADLKTFEFEQSTLDVQIESDLPPSPVFARRVAQSLYGVNSAYGAR